jgi:hypothetical protein
MIEHLRRHRGIAYIGPTCTGKTTILKLVSNALNLAFGIKIRTSVINPATLSHDELYGQVQGFTNNAYTRSQNNSNNKLSKKGVFQIILDTFEKEKHNSNDKGVTI